MDLKTALALLAGVVLLGLLVHFAWVARRARTRAAEPAALLAADAAGRVEPAWVSDIPVQASLPAAELRPVRKVAPIDALIDAIVPLALDGPVSAEAILAHLPPSRRAGTKPMAFEGQDVESGQWEPIAAGRRYSEVQAAVQLANRSGALNQIEYSEFVQKIQAFADGIGAATDFPDMREVVGRARELDGLTAALDAQLTVTLRSNSVAWSAGYIQQTAARHGFVSGALPGRLVVPGTEEGAPPVLVLSFDAQAALAEDPQRVPVRECTLTLDVPQTDGDSEPFPAWHRAAVALADDMDATLVDDQGQPITLHAFAAIGKELETLYERLQALDLPAGSAAARRLFSG